VYFGSVDFLTAQRLNIYPFGYVALTLFIVIVAYLIVTHEFFDVNILLRQVSLGLIIYLFLFGFSLPCFMVLMNRLAPRLSSTEMSVVVFVGLYFGVCLSAVPFIYNFLLRNKFWLKSHLTMGLTHELKSPLGSIRGGMDILEHELASGTIDKTKIDDYMHMINRNVDRLDGFIKNLLDLAAIQESAVSVKKENVCLTPMLAHLYDSYKLLLKEKNLEFACDVDNDLSVWADKEKLEQVFSNLISNAIKFTDSGKINVSVSKKVDHILCEISDTEKGITPFT